MRNLSIDRGIPVKRAFATIILLNLLFWGAIGAAGYFGITAAYHAIARDFGGK